MVSEISYSLLEMRNHFSKLSEIFYKVITPKKTKIGHSSMKCLWFLKY